jgi:ATP-dependent helicase HrpB
VQTILEERLAASSAARAGSPIVVLPLFGDLSANEQDAALAPSQSGSRKVVLATNIAETSLTIPGVRIVVDSGLVRRSVFDPATGMSRLETQRISRASADQRQGRAGRVESGVCYRAWSEGAQRSLAPFSPPEITDADLTPLALDLANWGARDATELRWLDPPPAAMLSSARDLLTRLGALDAEGRITPHGREMASLGVHPRLAHMLLKARVLGGLAQASDFAALLSERDLLRGAPGSRDADVRSRRDVFRSDRAPPGVDWGAFQRAKKMARDHHRRLSGASLGRSEGSAGTSGGSAGTSEGSAGRSEGSAGRSEGSAGRSEGGAGRSEGSAGTSGGTVGTSDGRSDRDFPPSRPAIEGSPSDGVLLAFAYPDRIARRRPGSEPRYTLANGRGAHFADTQSLGRQEFIVAIDLDDRERDARILLAAPLARADLEKYFADRIERTRSVEWNSREQAVTARRVVRLDAVVIEESPLPEVPVDAARSAMLAGLRELGLTALNWTRDARDLQARMEFVRRAQGRAEDRAEHRTENRTESRTENKGSTWPAVDDASLATSLEEWLAPWLDGVTRKDHLSRISLVEALRAILPWDQQRRLDELAPTHLEVPTGSRIRIDYLDESAPIVAVRLQEVFGLEKTPMIGGGRVPITFKLLSPAQRPVQVTKDLAGFWRGSYADVRKDMRGRYPKHYWPENPLEAEPTRGVRRKP